MNFRTVSLSHETVKVYGKSFCLTSTTDFTLISNRECPRARIIQVACRPLRSLSVDGRSFAPVHRPVIGLYDYLSRKRQPFPFGGRRLRAAIVSGLRWMTRVVGHRVVSSLVRIRTDFCSISLQQKAENAFSNRNVESGLRIVSISCE